MSGIQRNAVVLLASALVLAVFGCKESASVYDVYPAPGAQNVPADTDIRVSFSRKMQVETVNVDTFKVYGQYYGDFYPGTITANEEGTQFTFSVGQRDDGGQGYISGEIVTVYLQRGITGLDNIPFEGREFSFHVAGVVPDLYLGPIRVVSTVPSAGRRGVPLGTPLAISFSRRVVQATVSAGLKVYGSWTGLRSGTISFPGAMGTLAPSALFVPATPFLPGETYHVVLAGSIKGEDPRDTFAPYGCSFTVASGAVGDDWIGAPRALGVAARRIVTGDLRLSLPGLEAALLDDAGVVYLFAPRSGADGLSNGFSVFNGTIGALAAADLLDEGRLSVLALAEVAGRTRLLFLQPEGFAGIAESRDALEVDGRYARALVVGDFTGNAVPDVVMAGADGLLMLAREAPASGTAGLPPGLGDLLGGGAGTEPQFEVKTGVLPVLGAVDDVRAADLNGDGRLDLVIRQGNVLSEILWRDGRFGAVKPIATLGGHDAFCLVHMDMDGLADLVATRFGPSPAISMWRGTGEGLGEEMTDSVPLPAVPGGRVELLAEDMDGNGIPELIIAAPGFQDVFFLSLAPAAGGYQIITRTTPAPSITALGILDYDGDAWPDLIAASGDELWVFEAASGEPPLTAAQIVFAADAVQWSGDGGTVAVTLRGESAFDFDRVRIGFTFPSEELALQNVSFPVNSFFNAQNATLSVCGPEQGCDARVMITLSTLSMPFNLRREVDLVTVTFRPLAAAGAASVLRLENALEASGGAKVDNAFRLAGQEAWITAGLPEPELVIASEGVLLSAECRLETAPDGHSASATIAWSSPRGDALSQVRVTRNGVLIHSASGAGEYTDTAVENGINTYMISSLDGSVVRASVSCELTFVPPPVIIFCGVEGDHVVVRWDATALVDGFQLFRGTVETPFQVYGADVREYRVLDNTALPGYVYGVSAVFNGQASAPAMCEGIVGGGEQRVTLPRSFVARPAFDDPYFIELSWTQGAGYNELVVVRNGERIARLGPVSTYRDGPRAPGLYSYQIIAVADGDEKTPVTAPSVAVYLPLPTGLTCAYAGDYQVALQWVNPAAAQAHYDYDSVVLERTWLNAAGQPSGSVRINCPPDATETIDTVDVQAGAYRYALFVRYNGEDRGYGTAPVCEVPFENEVRLPPTTVGAGLEYVPVPIEATLVGAAEQVRFRLWYAGGGGRLTLTGHVPGPGVSSVAVTVPSTSDGVTYSIEVTVNGPVGPGENVELCRILFRTAADFARYGYDVEPPNQARRVVAVSLEDVRVVYPGRPPEVLAAQTSQVTVTCRYLLAASVENVRLNETFSVPVFGTFDAPLVGYTMTFAYDRNALECLGTTVVETETPPGLFLIDGIETVNSVNGTTYVSWIASFQPLVTFPAGFHRLMAYVRFRAIGASGSGAELRFAPISMGSGQTQRPLLNPEGWMVGTFLEATFDADVEIVAPPKITHVAPARGPVEGGSRLEVFGASFGASAPVVLVDGRVAPVIHHDNDRILCTVPSLPSVPDADRTVSVNVRNAQGTASLSNAFKYERLAVASLSPAAGSITGGNQVRISGAGMPQGIQVFFGATAAQIVSVDTVEGTSVIVTAPPGIELGKVDVVLQTPLGQQGVLAAGYEYIGAAPAITQIAPDRGPAGGGTTVAVSGTDFVQVLSVLFGSRPAAVFHVISDTRIDAVSPAGEGVVDLVVRTAGGEARAPFTYEGTLLSVAGFSPQRGSAQGGTEVVLTGAGFTAGLEVFFGDVAAVSVTVRSATEAAARTPAGAGQVSVGVSLPGFARVTAPQVFTYEDHAPLISTFQPQSGPPEGGTLVEVFGEYFIPETRIFVGGVEAQSVTYVSQQVLRFVTPPGTDAASVAAENPGTARTTAAETFAYVREDLAVTSMVPAAGSRFGDTLVVIQGAGFSPLVRVFMGPDEVPAARVTRVSDTWIEMRTPAHAPGEVGVTVLNPDGPPVSAPQDYVFEEFVFGGAAPLSGSICGWGEVTVSGSSFHTGIAVFFGGVPARSIEVDSEYQLRAFTPEVPEGTGMAVIAIAYDGITLEGPTFEFRGVQFIRGDTNGDGRVDIADALRLMNFLHGLENLGAPIDAADADDNGLVNSADARYLYTYLLGGGPPPPPPFPHPGEDPTPDSLTGCAWE